MGINAQLLWLIVKEVVSRLFTNSRQHFFPHTVVYFYYFIVTQTTCFLCWYPHSNLIWLPWVSNWTKVGRHCESETANIQAHEWMDLEKSKNSSRESKERKKKERTSTRHDVWTPNNLGSRPFDRKNEWKRKKLKSREKVDFSKCANIAYAVSSTRRLVHI